MNSLWRARKGTTLVEILVVMAVLLVGIMTVVMMFPTGFRVVRAAESQTIATKLAQAEVERWKNMPGNLPDDILPLKYGTFDDILNDEDPDPDFHGMEPVTGVADQYYPGNTGNFRKVVNETTSIPLGSYFQTGGGTLFGSRYNLAFSPIELKPDPEHANQYLGITVKSGDLLRRVGDHDYDIYLRPGQYGIDYNDSGVGSNCLYVCFRYDHNTDHVYFVSYSYTVTKSSGNGDAQYLSRINQEVNPSADGQWVPVPISVPIGYQLDSVDEGTDSCARGFTQLDSVTGTWTDPYEFIVADSILGVIAFNPNAHNALERTARGIRAVTARISYTIYDTRIIREERVVAAPNEDLDPDSSHTADHTQVKLALKYILDSGDPTDITDGDPTDNPGEPTFEGLVYSQLGKKVLQASDIAVAQPMLVVDLATGLRVELPSGLLSPKKYPIDFAAGVVHLPVKANLIDWNSDPVYTNVKLQGRHLRFFYRADGDWSIQCQKAHTYFLREYDRGATIDYQRYKLILGSDNVYKLLFARCMTGQSVAVDYTYTEGGAVHKVTGRNLRISDDVVTGTTCPYVVLGPASKIAIDPADRIIVVGTSFRSRVIWRDGKAWRYVDIDTNLTRGSVR